MKKMTKTQLKNEMQRLVAEEDITLEDFKGAFEQHNNDRRIYSRMEREFAGRAKAEGIKQDEAHLMLEMFKEMRGAA